MAHLMHTFIAWIINCLPRSHKTSYYLFYCTRKGTKINGNSWPLYPVEPGPFRVFNRGVIWLPPSILPVVRKSFLFAVPEMASTFCTNVPHSLSSYNFRLTFVQNCLEGLNFVPILDRHNFYPIFASILNNILPWFTFSTYNYFSVNSLRNSYLTPQLL